MRTAPPILPRDPEFDHPPRPAGRKPPAEVIGFYQRLFVNPFLSIVTLAATVLLCVMAGRIAWGPIVPAAALLGTTASGLVLQYHCLDCGATGWYLRWRRHACPHVVDRWKTPLSAASHRFPMPGTQLFLWMIGLPLLAFFWVISRL